ncbi:MAG: glycoside hydrolase family 95 protein [Candidatus Marinimicrobia bacterium]|nr:glycoside hydrolase family 95 protein [Candidatus Neomarinimicrobiota bacterium]
MKKTIFFLLLLSLILSFGSTKSAVPLKLWYDEPADGWNKALPIGNGRLGAMIFGNPAREKLQLNEETVWAGHPYNNCDAESGPYIPQVRKLLFQGKYKKAQKLANDNMMNEQNGMPYQPVGNLHINFPGHQNFSNYYRDLNIEKAVSSVSYSVEGVTFRREIFSSFTDDVIIMKVTADRPEQINCELHFTSPQTHSEKYNKNKIILAGKSGNREGIEGKIKFETQVKPILDGGSIVVQDTSIMIKNANSVKFYISIGTNFKNYKELSVNHEKEATTRLQAALEQDYDTAKNKHIHNYQKYFNRVELDLGTTNAAHKPTDIRIENYPEGYDPHLAALYFQFGRYLLISSSQPGGQPATLQGIWNHEMSPPWDCKYTLDINLEMNYWPADKTNLPEMAQPLFKLIKGLSETGQECAKTLYDARGWVVHHNTDIWRAAGIYDGAYWGLWQTGSAWLTQSIWRHYMYSGNHDFLEKFYPVLKDAAIFYIDELVKDPDTGYLVIGPSTSPENEYMEGITASFGTTMDNQLLFDLFTNVIRASKILEQDEPLRDTLLNLRDKLPPMQIGQYNQLQEWLFDWDDTTDHHRHVSHLYGLYPGNQISPYRTPLLFQAAKNSLKYRGDESTGWSMGWKVNLWARLLDGEHAYKLLQDQINPAILSNGEEKGGTYPNMLDAHPPFQIDGNFGCAAGIAEMLMQSHDGFIFILPALPDKWKNGEIKGLQAQGGFQIDISWKNGKIDSLKVDSELSGNCRLRIYNPIEAAGNAQLKKAVGTNPNPFYKTKDLKPAKISPKANIELIGLKKTYLYDFATQPGKTYKFHLK